MNAAALILKTRTEAGLTQAELARRLGRTQPTVASLERPGANPTVATLDAVLRALGRRLELSAVATPPDVDEAQLDDPSGRRAGVRQAARQRGSP